VPYCQYLNKTRAKANTNDNKYSNTTNKKERKRVILIFELSEYPSSLSNVKKTDPKNEQIITQYNDPIEKFELPLKRVSPTM